MQGAMHNVQQTWKEIPLPSLSYMTVRFMCQLNWVMRHSDIWLNIILGVSVRAFLDHTVTFFISKLSKAYCLPQCGQASSNLLKA